MAMPPLLHGTWNPNHFRLNEKPDLTPEGLKGLSALAKSQLMGGHSATVPGASRVPGARSGVPNGILSSPDEWLCATSALKEENEALRALLKDVKEAQIAEAVQAIAEGTAHKYATLQNTKEAESAERRAQQKPRRREDLLAQIQSCEANLASESQCLKRRIAEVNVQRKREELRTAAAEQRIKSLQVEAANLEERIQRTREEKNEKVKTCFAATSKATEEWVMNPRIVQEISNPHDALDIGPGETDWRHLASPRRNHSALSFDTQRVGLTL